MMRFGQSRVWISGEMPDVNGEYNVSFDNGTERVTLYKDGYWHICADLTNDHARVVGWEKLEEVGDE